MAARDRPKLANYLAQETYTVDTRDHEDHTFCGIMFDVHCRTTRPVEYLEIQSLWVRGDLGPMKVFATPDGFCDEDKAYDELNNAVHKDPECWTLLFEKTLAESIDVLQELPLSTPIQLQPNKTYGFYIHSSLPGDRGLVYDNQRGKVTHSDQYLQVLPGLAHVSYKPFSPNGPWRRGRAWRANRQFVGRITYGVKWTLWNPEVHDRFPSGFQRLVDFMTWCHADPDSSIHPFPWDVLLYIVNMCRWDWGAAFQPAEEEPEHTDVSLAGISILNEDEIFEEVDDAQLVVDSTNQMAGIAGDTKFLYDDGACPPDVTIIRHEDFYFAKSYLARCNYSATFLDWTETGSNLLIEGLTDEQFQTGTRLEFGQGGCFLEILGKLEASPSLNKVCLGLMDVLSIGWRCGARCRVLRGGLLSVGQDVYVRSPALSPASSPTLCPAASQTSACVPAPGETTATPAATCSATPLPLLSALEKASIEAPASTSSAANVHSADQPIGDLIKVTSKSTVVSLIELVLNMMRDGKAEVTLTGFGYMTTKLADVIQRMQQKEGLVQIKSVQTCLSERRTSQLLVCIGKGTDFEALVAALPEQTAELIEAGDVSAW